MRVLKQKQGIPVTMAIKESSGLQDAANIPESKVPSTSAWRERLRQMIGFQAINSHRNLLVIRRYHSDVSSEQRKNQSTGFGDELERDNL
jgi:hypothetical protein